MTTVKVNPCQSSSWQTKTLAVYSPFGSDLVVHPKDVQMLSHANKISFKQSWKIYEYFLRTKLAPEIPIRLNLLSNYVFVYAFDFSLVIV